MKDPSFEYSNKKVTLYGGMDASARYFLDRAGFCPAAARAT